MSSRQTPPQRSNVAAIYCRVSTAAQEEGTSLDTQESACRKFATARGYTVAEAHIYREVHTGGELWERPQLTAMREAVRRGEVRAVIAYAVDRLSREQAHLFILDDEATRAGAELLFVTEEFDKTPVGKMVRGVKAFAAEIEREKIKERTLRGKRATVEKGRPLRGPMPLYGYTWRADGSGYDPDPNTAPVVRRMFAEYLGGRSLRAVGAALAVDGIPSPTGQAKWGPTSIRNVLSNPAYAGQARGWRWHFEKKPGGGTRRLEHPEADQVILPPEAVPALVDEATFRAVQGRLEHNKASAAGRPPSVEPEGALLRGGFARCGYCGGSMYVTYQRTKKNGPYALYRCSPTNTDRHGCPSFAIAADRLDREVWSYIIGRMTRADVLAAEWRHRQEEGPSDDELQSVERALAEVGRQQAVMANAIAALADTDASAPLLVKLQALANQKRTLEAERERAAARIQAWHDARDRLDQAEAWCKTIATKAADANYAMRRALFALMDVRVKVYASDRTPRYEGEAWIPTGDHDGSALEWRQELFTSSARCGAALRDPPQPTPRARAQGTAGRRGSRRGDGRVRACRAGIRPRHTGAGPP